MNSFPSEISFNKPWRSYQERVLDELSKHMKDNHLHIVAAPGSGKTVLGLEVVRRLNQPALILAPTITIRNQWIERFVNLFMTDCTTAPDWISTDIKNPGFMTVATYQALHCVYTGVSEEEGIEGEETEEEISGMEEEADCDIDVNVSSDKTNSKIDVIKLLNDTGIKTIVVDEAHHLRTEWWKSLTAVKDKLKNATIVALTATPPYDVTPLEWDRYQELCGSIDAEISVPELVLEGNLCPHQDYIYFNYPLKEENLKIKEFRHNVEQFIKNIYANKEFITAIAKHHWFELPKEHIEEFLSDPSFFSSIVVFLNHVQEKVPNEFIRIMGLSRKSIPVVDLEWMEILLTGCLYTYSESYVICEPIMKEIRQYLSRIGAVEKRKVVLRSTKEIKKALVSSIGKLNSINEIVRLESQSLGDKLRMVILTDYIRKSELPKDGSDIKSLNKIGVIPIFELIRREGFKDIRLGILSGSFVAIPKSSEQALINFAVEAGIQADRVKVKPLSHDDNYCTVEITGQDKQMIVNLITKLFSNGEITVLVGTKSLLGEGWDAPSISSLILASFVGSYMLSNQMRGRAIRSQSGNPNKTANIWHLVCIEPESNELGDDLEMLSRRFKAFLGVAFKEPVIENGIVRLDIGKPPFTPQKISILNQEMRNRAIDREGLIEKWKTALKLGEKGISMVEELRAPEISLPRGFVFFNTITAMLWEGVFIGGYIFTQFLAGTETSTPKEFLTLLLIAFFAGAVFALPKFIKGLLLLMKHGTIESSMNQIGKVLLEALAHEGIIKTKISKLRIRTEKGKYGDVFCSLEGGTAYEKSVYLSSFQEMLNPIENPRYILIRKSMLFGVLIRKDYHAVPQLLGRKKESAEYFKRGWEQRIGDAELIYTRTVEGRQLLLKARAKAFSSAFLKRAERISCWK